MSIMKFKEQDWKPKKLAGDRVMTGGKPVTSSLAGSAVQVRQGNGEPAKYAYEDGRICGHPDGDLHDCAYVTARNRLIPEAERIALRESQRIGKPMTFARFFMAAMDELWQDAKGGSQ